MQTLHRLFRETSGTSNAEYVLILAIVGKAYPERPRAHDRAHRHLGFQLHRAYGVSRLPVRGLINQLPIGRERRFDMRA